MLASWLSKGWSVEDRHCGLILDSGAFSDQLANKIQTMEDFVYASGKKKVKNSKFMTIFGRSNPMLGSKTYRILARRGMCYGFWGAIPCPLRWWTQKCVGSWRLWVMASMGYEGADCIMPYQYLSTPSQSAHLWVWTLPPNLLPQNFREGLLGSIQPISACWLRGGAEV